VPCWLKCLKLFHEVVSTNLNKHVLYHTCTYTSLYVCMYVYVYVYMYTSINIYVHFLKCKWHAALWWWMTHGYHHWMHHVVIFHKKKNNCPIFYPYQLVPFIKGLAKYLTINLSKFTKNVMEHMVNSPTFLNNDFFLIDLPT
jgi:hypothetical protein